MKIIGIDAIDSNKKLKIKKIIITISISIILIIAFILICLYIGNKPFHEFIDKYVLMKNVVENNVTSISLEGLENYNAYAYDKYISILSQNTLNGYNISGKKEYELTIEITNPIVDSNNKYLLIAEKGKQKIYLISGNSIVWEKELEGNINRVSVNKNGYTSVILTGTTYKSIIQTFDNTGKELFKTYLGNSIAMDSEISNDNKYLSFAEISTNGTLAQSIIKTVSISKAQEKSSETISASIINSVKSPNDAVPLSIKYQDGNKLICMYDNSIHCFQNESNDEILNFNDDSKKITYADIELTNYIAYVTEKKVLLNTESTIELINTGNKKTNIYTTDNVIKELYTYDNKLALNLGSEVHFIGTNGWIIKKYISSQEVRKIIMSSNFAGIVYRNKIEIVEL